MALLILQDTRYIKSTYPATSIILESHAAQGLKDVFPFPIYTNLGFMPYGESMTSRVDLVVTFGGDGTLLHASSLYSNDTSVSPILSFSLGTLGFLTTHNPDSYATAFDRLYHSGPSGGATKSKEFAKVQMRQRLRVLLPPLTSASYLSKPRPSVIHALNEVLLHRGSTPHLTNINIRISPYDPTSPDLRQPQPLTTSISDGILLSTPTGSTAYSLSAGGSIVHPSVPAILLTPICARSLSFRPLILPDNVEVELSLDNMARGSAEISIDGLLRGRLHRKLNAALTTPSSQNLLQNLLVARSADYEGGTEDLEEGPDEEVAEQASGLARDDSKEEGRKAMKMNKAPFNNIPMEEMEGNVIRVRKEEGLGVPTVVPDEGGSDGGKGGDGWVGGLNRLLKFNSRFGEAK